MSGAVVPVDLEEFDKRLDEAHRKGLTTAEFMCRVIEEHREKNREADEQEFLRLLDAAFVERYGDKTR